MTNKYLVEGSENELTTKTAAELAGLIHSREVTSREVTQAHLDRIAAVDGDIHAFLHVGQEEALNAADDVDKRLDAGGTCLGFGWRAACAEGCLYHH